VADRCPGSVVLPEAQNRWLARVRSRGAVAHGAARGAGARGRVGRRTDGRDVPRENLQVRGLPGDAAGALAAPLQGTGLLPSAAHDVRVTSLPALPAGRQPSARPIPLSPRSSVVCATTPHPSRLASRLERSASGQVTARARRAVPVSHLRAGELRRPAPLVARSTPMNRHAHVLGRAPSILRAAPAPSLRRHGRSVRCGASAGRR